MPKRSSKRKDINELAKSIVDRATGDQQKGTRAAKENVCTDPKKIASRRDTVRKKSVNRDD